MKSHPWALTATCKHPQCRTDFPVAYEGNPQVFPTRAEALKGLQDAMVKDMLRLAHTIQGAIADLAKQPMPNKPAMDMRLLRCPSCKREYVYNGSELFVAERMDFSVELH